MSNETSVKTEYKETLNLPQTTLAMRANATVRELEIQKFWEEHIFITKLLTVVTKQISLFCTTDLRT
ncbi:MAG: hypothetical protein ACLSA2_00660 [Candidatus Gastranaerophilaceae bacterium]